MIHFNKIEEVAFEEINYLKISEGDLTEVAKFITSMSHSNQEDWDEFNTYVEQDLEKLLKENKVNFCTEADLYIGLCETDSCIIKVGRVSLIYKLDIIEPF